MLVDVHIKTNFVVLHYVTHSEHCLLYEYGAPKVTWWWNKYETGSKIIRQCFCVLSKKISFPWESLRSLVKTFAFVRKSFVFFAREIKVSRGERKTFAKERKILLNSLFYIIFIYITYNFCCLMHVIHKHFIEFVVYHVFVVVVIFTIPFHGQWGPY